MGRADQTTKVKGMFVRPEQIDSIRERHPELLKLRLVVTRSADSDAMTLPCEVDAAARRSRATNSRNAAIDHQTARSVEFVAPGSLPNDGKVIADERAG